MCSVLGMFGILIAEGVQELDLDFSAGLVKWMLPSFFLDYGMQIKSLKLRNCRPHNFNSFRSLTNLTLQAIDLNNRFLDITIKNCVVLESLY